MSFTTSRRRKINKAKLSQGGDRREEAKRTGARLSYIRNRCLALLVISQRRTATNERTSERTKGETDAVNSSSHFKVADRHETGGLISAIISVWSVARHSPNAKPREITERVCPISAEVDQESDALHSSLQLQRFSMTKRKFAASMSRGTAHCVDRPSIFRSYSLFAHLIRGALEELMGVS